MEFKVKMVGAPTLFLRHGPLRFCAVLTFRGFIPQSSCCNSGLRERSGKKFMQCLGCGRWSTFTSGARTDPVRWNDVDIMDLLAEVFGEGGFDPLISVLLASTMLTVVAPQLRHSLEPTERGRRSPAHWIPVLNKKLSEAAIAFAPPAM